MRILFAIVWCIFLFVCTCTYNFDQLLHHLNVHFFFTPHPDWHNLLITNDYNVWSRSSFIIQKTGHFCGFFVLTLILTDLGRHKYGAWISVCYAVFTEILQLYFYRDGRIIDMFIDSSGILLAYWLCQKLFGRRKWSA